MIHHLWLFGPLCLRVVRYKVISLVGASTFLTIGGAFLLCRIYHRLDFRVYVDDAASEFVGERHICVSRFPPHGCPDESMHICGTEVVITLL